MKVIFKVILKSVNHIHGGLQRGGGALNWEQYFIGLFHVSEHIDRLKAMKYSREEKKFEMLFRPLEMPDLALRLICFQ